MENLITKEQIMAGAKFETKVGIVEIIETIPGYYDRIKEECGLSDTTAVKTKIGGYGDSSGAPYCDDIDEVVDFINENRS